MLLAFDIRGREGGLQYWFDVLLFNACAEQHKLCNPIYIVIGTVLESATIIRQNACRH